MADCVGGSRYVEVPVELGSMGMNGAPANAPPLLDTPPCQGSREQAMHKCGIALWEASLGNAIICGRGNGASATICT